LAELSGDFFLNAESERQDVTILFSYRFGGVVPVFANRSGGAGRTKPVDQSGPNIERVAESLEVLGFQGIEHVIACAQEKVKEVAVGVHGSQKYALWK
jgi:hypothetical protein